MIIGLTGNIGSGKSTIARYLEELGARVIYSDYISRKIVEPGKPALKKIKETFGPGVVNEDNTLNRKALGEVVFKDSEARKKLDSIMHPLIIEEIKEEIRKYKNDRSSTKAPALIVEIPLLFETGMENLFNEIWVVTVEKKVQINRISKRDNINEKQAKRRIDSQMPQSLKAEKAHRVIDNSGNPDKTKKKIEELWKYISNDS